LITPNPLPPPPPPSHPARRPPLHAIIQLGPAFRGTCPVCRGANCKIVQGEGESDVYPPTAGIVAVVLGLPAVVTLAIALLLCRVTTTPPAQYVRAEWVPQVTVPPDVPWDRLAWLGAGALGAVLVTVGAGLVFLRSSTAVEELRTT
jgi:hypothetical protein